MSDEITGLWDKITTGVQAVWTSLVRTIVPVVVGAVVSFFTTIGIPVDDDFKQGLTLILSAVFAVLYYLLARLLEQSFAWASKLLLSGKAPVAYAPTKAVTASAVTAAPTATVGTVRSDAPDTGAAGS